MVSFSTDRRDADAVLTSIRRMVAEEVRKPDAPVEAVAGSDPDQVIDDPILEDPDDAGPLMLTSDHVIAPLARNTTEPLAAAMAAVQLDAAPDLPDVPDETTGATPAVLDTLDVGPSAYTPPSLDDQDPEDIPETVSLSSPVADWTATSIAAVGGLSPVAKSEGTDMPSADKFADQAEPVGADPVQPIGPIVNFDLNEEHLRALIKQMIREELEGELGERMTRNIRKLIRQEMLRAFDVKS